MACRLAIALIVFHLLESFAQEKTLVLETKSGRIKGKLVTNTGKTFGVFQAIPFVEAPIGQNRFKDPIVKNAWSPDTLDASKGFGSRCPQPQPVTAYNDLSEDCLFLNVFTPKSSTGQNTKYPVMVFIHGGGLRLGSANDYPEASILTYFVSKGVVFVSINYRLGPLGFWTTRSCAAGGNMGFKDQRMALIWVRDHIAAFGGDPEQVTIVGESSGALSCEFLTLSPTTRGLFSQAILQSNSVMASWTTMKERKDEKSARLAQVMGCLSAGAALGNCQTDLKVLGCMQSKDADEMATVLKESDLNMDVTDLFIARIGDDFLPEDLQVLAAKRPPMNVMMGTCRDEWGFFELHSTISITPEQVESEMPRQLKVFGVKNGTSKVAAIKFEYVDSQLHNPGVNASFWYNQAVKMKSAVENFAPLYEGAMKLVDSGSKVYLYSFDYLSENVMQGMGWRGVVHASDLQYQFNKTDPTDVQHIIGPNPRSAPDYRVQDLFSELWTNFAKFGNPTPEPVQGAVWEPLEKSRANYLSLNDPPQMKDGYNWRDVTFWNGLIRELDKTGSNDYEEKGNAQGIFDGLVKFLRSVLKKF